MLSDKEAKKLFKEKASKSPEKYYAVNILKSEGFKRKRCKICGTYFWSIDERDVCGDPACSGGYNFIGNSPVKKPMSYVEVWKKFSIFFKERSYTPIKRYPVVARWRDDTDFVQASIYDFQPWVVSGEVEPPANPLVVPQFCLRFNDIENVGITGAHYTGFVMIGQHAFTPPEKYDQEKYFTDIHEWLTKGLGLKKEEIIYHEDAWAGGGNLGPSMEFFSRGLELGNQVYMQFYLTENGYKELSTKVLDMGMGQERNAWFASGALSSYEVVMPHVIQYIKKETGVELDKELYKKFAQKANLLNIDEIKNIEKSWTEIAKFVGISVEELNEIIKKIAAIYAIADHTRALFMAINDGALPSNVGGGYNLRLILRRALALEKRYGWELDHYKIAELHVKDLKSMYPELKEGIEHYMKIFSIEKDRYNSTLQRNRKIIKKELEKGEITKEKLVKLYESYGIHPEEIINLTKEEGIKIELPKNINDIIRKEVRKETKKDIEKTRPELDLDELPETIALYFDYYDYCDFEANVVKIKDNLVVLDRTAFYPTSGGQKHDIGWINGIEVIDVYKQGRHIIHVLKEKPNFKEKDKVVCKIDKERRIQLTQHHTATHILNGAAKKVLGKHVWQAGAEKDLDKARLDITHYAALSKEEEQLIEKLANEIVEKNLPVYKYFLERNIAEQRFGMTIYQGGAVPGKKIRIVEIPGFDVEACGGTHLNTTGEAQFIKIKRTSRIQDGVVRIEFVAGMQAQKEMDEAKEILIKVSKKLSCEIEEVPARVEELFMKWKKIKKIVKKMNKKQDKGQQNELELQDLFRLSSNVKSEGDYIDILKEAAEKIRTQPEHLEKTIDRFLNEMNEMKKKLINGDK